MSTHVLFYVLVGTKKHYSISPIDRLVNSESKKLLEAGKTLKNEEQISISRRDSAVPWSGYFIANGTQEQMLQMKDDFNNASISSASPTASNMTNQKSSSTKQFVSPDPVIYADLTKSNSKDAFSAIAASQYVMSGEAYREFNQSSTNSTSTRYENDSFSSISDRISTNTDESNKLAVILTEIKKMKEELLEKIDSIEKYLGMKKQTNSATKRKQDIQETLIESSSDEEIQPKKLKKNSENKVIKKTKIGRIKRLGNVVDTSFREMIINTNFIINGKLVTKPENNPSPTNQKFHNDVAAMVFTEGERFHGSLGSARKRHKLIDSRINYFKCCLIKAYWDHSKTYDDAYCTFVEEWPSILNSIKQSWRDFTSRRTHAIEKAKKEGNLNLTLPPFPYETVENCQNSTCLYCSVSFESLEKDFA